MRPRMIGQYKLTRRDRLRNRYLVFGKASDDRRSQDAALTDVTTVSSKIPERSICLIWSAMATPLVKRSFRVDITQVPVDIIPGFYCFTALTTILPGHRESRATRHPPRKPSDPPDTRRVIRLTYAWIQDPSFPRQLAFRFEHEPRRPKPAARSEFDYVCVR